MRFSRQVLAMAFVLASASTGWAKEKLNVTVSYVLAPERPVPAGLKAVAVIDAGVRTEGLQQDEREQRWSKIAADMVEAMVQSSAQQFNSGLAVANRRLTGKLLEEKDLKLAGLVQGERATRAGKLLDVQGLITTAITINIDVQKTTKSQLDWGGLVGTVFNQQGQPAPPPPGYQPRRRVIVRRNPQTASRRGRYYNPRPAPAQPVYVAPQGGPPPGPAYAEGPEQGGPLLTREVEEISRSLTVQCSYALVDAATGEILLQYTTPRVQKSDKASPDFFFGGMIDESKLDPVDHFIGELVERATQQFVGQLVPVQTEFTYEITGRDKPGERALIAMRAGDSARALELMQAQYRDKPDKFENVFALAVLNEINGRFEEALKHYREAATLDDAEDEEAELAAGAAKRLSDHLPRILRPQQPPAEAVETGRSAAPEK